MTVPSSIPLPFPRATSEVVAHYIHDTKTEQGSALTRLSGLELRHLIGASMQHLRGLIGPRSTAFSCILASGDPVEVAIAALATWRLGGRVILPPNLRTTTLSRLQERLGAHDIPVVMPRLTLNLLDRATTESDASTGSEQWQTAIDSDDTILTCYTSGTTGEPEAADKTARQLLGEAQLLASQFMTTPGRGVVCSVPTHHLYGFLFGVLAPLYGQQILVGGSGPERPSLKSLTQDLFEPQLVSVPVHLRSLLATQRDLLGSFQSFFSSSAPLPQKVGEELLTLSAHARLIEIFGSSETGGIATRQNAPGGAWRPLPGLTIAADERGLLSLRSPFTEAGIDVPFTTSDQIEVLPDGFRHLGRKDGVVKIGGKRVSLQELEARALEQTEIADVACVTLTSRGLRHQEIGMVVVARALPESAFQFKQELRQRLRQHFDDVVIPRRIRLVESLPRKTTGKLEQAELIALFEDPTSSVKPPAALDGFADFRITSQQLDLDCRDAHLEYEVRLSAEQIWFQGHFPKFAVLPGVVQLRSLVLECARHYWPDLRNLRSQRQVKFKRPLIPGDTLRVRLSPERDPTKLTFNIEWLGNPLSSERGPVPAASGVLYFEN